MVGVEVSVREQQHFLDRSDRDPLDVGPADEDGPEEGLVDEALRNRVPAGDAVAVTVVAAASVAAVAWSAPARGWGYFGAMGAMKPIVAGATPTTRTC